MPRPVAAILLVLAPTIVSAATQRYVVSVKGDVAPAAILRDIAAGGIAPARRVAAFEHVSSFAIDLSEEEAARLLEAPGVRDVEPVGYRQILSSAARPSTNGIRNLGEQTIPAGLDLVRARDAWRFTRGAAINVVVMDTGIDSRHPDLAHAWAGGFNATAPSGAPVDDHNHGTHVAGIIAARDDERGVVGIAPDVRLWSVKALLANGAGTTDYVVAGINWVIGQKRALGGNWIINMSFGWPAPNNAEADAVARAIGEGILIVAGSGNDSTETIAAQVLFPGAYPGVFAVGAVDETLRRASFSNQGPRLGAVAPGIDVLSTVRLGGGNVTGIVSGAINLSGIALEGSGAGKITAPLVDCGLGRYGDFPADVAGKIAIIGRGGDITFAAKARRAKFLGVAGVIFVDYPDSASHHFTLINAGDIDARTFEWPISVAVGHAAGQRLLAATATPMTLVHEADDYALKSGTSMSSPHAAAVAALAWSIAPDATASQVINALKSSATDLGARGNDTVYGHGLIDAVGAARMLNPAVVDAALPSPSGRRSLRRGR